jgi:hypothetical protein
MRFFHSPVSAKTVLILLLIISGAVYIYWLYMPTNLPGSAFAAIDIYVFSLLVAITVIKFLVWVLVTWSKKRTPRNEINLIRKKGIWDFIVGDEGGYSLSRFQAVLWAVVIMGYQLSVLLTLLIKQDHLANVYDYDLVFSEPVIWLLGLSLGTCVSVKGITVSKLNEQPELAARKVFHMPAAIDLITGKNGLDFSKCQMLIWTFIAVLVFSVKVMNYNNSLYQTQDNASFFARDNFYEEYAKTPEQLRTDSQKERPFIPYISWTFVVLMGLSQGAYIGKKLVPSFKVDEAMQMERERLNFLLDQLATKKEMLAKILLATRTTRLSATDVGLVTALEKEIAVIESQVALLNIDIAKVQPG